MSQPTPDRTVPALPPRRPKAAGLMRENRTAVAPAEEAPPAPVDVSPASPPTPRKGQVNVEIDTEVRDTGKAAFRAAAFYEGVQTWSQYVENAIWRENERIAQMYNGGQPLEPMTARLPGGRPAAQG